MANIKHMITIELLKKIGETLYGSQWQGDLAKALGLKDSRSVRYWVSGERPIPSSLKSELINLLESNLLERQELIKILKSES